MSEPFPSYVELEEHIREVAREVAREEIASFSGMVLGRLSHMGPTRSPDRNMVVETLSQLFGEALKDFSGPSAPGA